MLTAIDSPDIESLFAPPPVNVTFHTYHNEYVYAPAKLWTAYGTVILVAAVRSTTGMVVIFVNGASHSFDFSSVFRSAWGASISEQVRDEDTSARDPLPAYLAAAKVTCAAGHAKEQQYEEVDTTSDVSPSIQMQGLTMTRVTT